MSTFFLSYAREDKATATQLKRVVENSFGVSIWMALGSLRGPQRERQIREAIRLADGGLFLASKHSLESGTDTRRELDLLTRKANKIGDAVFLIIVRVDGVQISDKQFNCVDLPLENANQSKKALDEIGSLIFSAQENRQRELTQKSKPEQEGAKRENDEFVLHPLATGRLFLPEEMDIYVNKVTKDAYIFHGKEIDYANLEYLLYVPDNHSVLVHCKDGACLDLGVRIQWLVRPYFISAHDINIVRTRNGETIVGTVVPLRFAQEGSDGKVRLSRSINASVKRSLEHELFKFKVWIGNEGRATKILKALGCLFVIAMIGTPIIIVAFLIRLIMWLMG